MQTLYKQTIRRCLERIIVFPTNQLNTIITISFVILMSTPIFSQLGGEAVYEFMSVAPSARITALGGMNLTNFDSDPNMGLQNPALYNKQMHRQFSIGNAFYLGGINMGNTSYVHHLDSLFTLGLDIQFANYGKSALTDPLGQTNGDFRGADYLFNIGLARQQGLLSYGVNFKSIFSDIESFNSFALAADIGAVYHNPDSEFTISAAFKNIGTQISTYDGEERKPLPFDIQVGIAKRLQYLPLRLSIQAHNLNKWDIRYDDPNQGTTNLFFETDTVQKNYFADNLFRHLVFGGEFYFGKSVRVRVGYNHLRRQELRLQNAAGLAGFTFGAGINIKKIKIDYGRGNYHFAGGNNHLSLTFDLDEIGLPKFGQSKKSKSKTKPKEKTKKIKKPKNNTPKPKKEKKKDKNKQN